MIRDLTDAMQDYLKEIHKLRMEGRRATTSAIAERMGVRPPSVTAMLKRLSALGLAKHAPYRGVELTPAGERVALEVIRHHRLLEQYLAQALGLSLDEVHSRGRPARARSVGGARGADRSLARLSDARPARRSDPGRRPPHRPRAPAHAREPRARRRGDDPPRPGRRRRAAALPEEAGPRPGQEGEAPLGRALRRPAHGSSGEERPRDFPRARRRYRRRVT